MGKRAYCPWWRRVAMSNHTVQQRHLQTQSTKSTNYGRKEDKMLNRCFKPKTTILLTAVLLSLVACNSESMLHNGIENFEGDLIIYSYFNIASEAIFDENKDLVMEPEYCKVDFVVHSGGTMVDIRIPNSAVEVILRHFEAIESGDLTMYRTTVGYSDAADLYHHMSLMIHYFGDIVNIDNDTFNLAMSEQFEMLSVIQETLFHETFPPRNRGTGLFVKKIELAYDFFAKTTVIDNNDNVFVYFLGVGLDESEENSINRHYNPNQLR